MAEYNDVIKHFKRMCRYYNNRATQNDCPLYCKGHGCNISHCRMLAFDDVKFQNVVMTWAENHKEPVYPTWREYLQEQGILDVEYIPAASSTTSTSKSYVQTVKTLAPFYRSIPADIAKKLGVKPKEE